ncbi:MAG: ribonuclease HI family protein [Spirochaetia bacterium]|nr:ribonuclease HI family protein [Spirochaetia bacterium]
MSYDFLLYCDGACRGNPGPSSIGAIAYRAGTEEPALLISKTTGTGNNKQAEYRSLLEGLRGLKALNAKSVEIRMDSQLVVRQVLGEYKVKHEGLKPLHAEVLALLKPLKWRINHVPREENKEADRLANEALDSPSIPG